MKKSISLFLFFAALSLNVFALSITSFNIRNFGTKTDLSLMTELLKNIDSDIFFFQEINNKDLFKNNFNEHFFNHTIIFSNCGGFGKQYLAIAFKNSFELVKMLEDTSFSMQSRCENGLRPALILELKDKESRNKFTLIDLHLKAGGDQNALATRKKQIDMLSTLIKSRESKKEKIYLAGDFNSIEYQVQREDFEIFNNFVALNKLQNLTDDAKCSYYGKFIKDQTSLYPKKLDHILANKFAMQDRSVVNSFSSGHCEISSCKPVPYLQIDVIYKKVSDHCPITAVVE